MLDPHKAWSSEIGFPGGPLYDFVANSDEPEIKNHLAAFDSILGSHNTAFEGTIIRLPLRDEDQAIRSQIVEDHISTSQKDIEDVFRLFTNELVESLLFLRNLRSITLRVDDRIFSKAESIVPNERKNDRGENPVNEGYRQVFVEQSKEHYESDFMMEVNILRSAEPDTAPSETKVKYAISHYLRKSTEDKSLQKWARSHKLFPWIAIANPLDVRLSSNIADFIWSKTNLTPRKRLISTEGCLLLFPFPLRRNTLPTFTEYSALPRIVPISTQGVTPP